MIGDAQAHSAELAADHRLAGAGRTARIRIAVPVEDVAHVVEAAATGLIHQPRGIERLDQLNQRLRVVLALRFVEHHPHDDRRMIPVALHQASQLGFELRHVQRLWVPGVGIGAGHVLPDQEAKLVGPVVPAGRLDLDVLADHVVAERPLFLNVALEGIVGRSGIDAVRPEALVERAELEDELVVQQHLHETIDRAQADLAHAEVAGHRVHRGRSLGQGDVQVVEEGMGWRPEGRIGHRQLQLDPRRAGDSPDHVRPDAGHGVDGDAAGRAVNLDLEADSFGGDVRQEPEARDARFGHRFQPHRLPDAGAGGVHDPAGIERLFAARLAGAVGWIVDPHDQLLGTAAAQIGRDVMGDLIVAALVQPGALAIDEDFRLPVHGIQVQQDALAAPVGRHGKRSAIP